MSEDHDDCAVSEAYFGLESEVGIRLQCLHRVLDCGDWNLALHPQETQVVLRAAAEMAEFVLQGKKPESNVRKLSEYTN